jgi:hypothetical protein
MRTVVAAGLAIFSLALSVASMAPSRSAAQGDPVAGEWRGTLKPPQGTESPIVITLVRKGDEYGGVTSGLTESSEVPLKRVTVEGSKVSIEAAADSKLGQVVLTADLALAGATLKGPATLAVGLQRFDVAFDLQRRARTTVLQRQVQQQVDYFVGRWKFEYVGGEFPPLSNGGRTGTIAFTRNGASNFATGQLEGVLLGKPYRETHTIGVDPETYSVVSVERRADGSEAVSLGTWRSPLAIVFQTAPVSASGKVFQLRRVVSVTSDTAFDVTEEFSTEGGAFRRLGNAHYTKQP